MQDTVPVTDENFDSEVLAASAEVPVLVDFWAPWCGPCRMLGPVLDNLARETVGRLKVVKLNTDEEPDTATRYQIRSIPAVKLFRNGRVAAEFVGAQPLSAVRAFVEPHLQRDSGLGQAQALRATGAYGKAIEALRALRVASADDTAIAVELAQLLALTGAADEAESLLGSLSPVAQSEAAVKAGYALVHFARLAGAPDETDVIQTARVSAARQLLRGELAAGIAALFTAAERNRRFASGEGRSDILKALDLAAPDDPILAQSRRRLAALLH